MEDLLKMPSQYVDQVMYPIRLEQQQGLPLISQREKKRSVSVEQQHQQQQQHARSAMTPTTRSNTSASNDS
jgi:hypothetical protein